MLKRTEHATTMQKIGMIALFAVVTTIAYGADNSRRLVISLADHKLVLIEEGRAVKVYPVAVGKPSTPSPTGSFEIVSRVAQPTWYGPHQVVAPGPTNPLGTRWMGLSEKGYGIHGTNAPQSIGKSASHGCIRMCREDLEELFELVQVGDQVELVPEATGELANIFESPEPRTSLKPCQKSVSHSVAGNRTFSPPPGAMALIERRGRN